MTFLGDVLKLINRRFTMKKFFLAITLLVVAGYAAASCPQFQPYRCVPGYNGKMICGCGV